MLFSNSDTSKGSNEKTHGKINFVAANKKQISDKVAQKTKKRGEVIQKSHCML